jgi:methyl-accepting chemotaxis protein
LFNCHSISGVLIFLAVVITPFLYGFCQFIPWYHKMNGPVEFASFADYQAVVWGDRETAGNPYVRKIQGKDTMIVRLTTPIIHPETKEVIGCIGVNCDLVALQGVVDQVIKDQDEVEYLAVYTSDGIVLSSYVPDRVGKNIREADSALFTNHMNDVVNAIGKGEQISVDEYSPVPSRPRTSATPWQSKAWGASKYWKSSGSSTRLPRW